MYKYLSRRPEVCLWKELRLVSHCEVTEKQLSKIWYNVVLQDVYGCVYGITHVGIYGSKRHLGCVCVCEFNYVYT